MHLRNLLTIVEYVCWRNLLISLLVVAFLDVAEHLDIPNNVHLWHRHESCGSLLFGLPFIAATASSIWCDAIVNSAIDCDSFQAGASLIFQRVLLTRWLGHSGLCSAF